MKKLFAMILMLGISPHAFSDIVSDYDKDFKEIKLICKQKDTGSGEYVNVDQSIKIGDYFVRRSDECSDRRRKCVIVEPGSVDYYETFYDTDGNVSLKKYIDRVDGTYKEWRLGKLVFTGTCKPFEAKF